MKDELLNVFTVTEETFLKKTVNIQQRLGNGAFAVVYKHCTKNWI